MRILDAIDHLFGRGGPGRSPERKNPPGFDLDPPKAADVAPLAVVIPVRNRSRRRLFRSLESLMWQSAGRPAQLIVVSHGSRPEIEKELEPLCREQDAYLIAFGRPSEPWNKSLALNIGIRATRPDIPFLMTMDSDMILAPNFFSVVLDRLEQSPPAIVVCRISDLPKDLPLPDSREELFREFGRLFGRTRFRKNGGSGAAQAASRSFFFDIHGYDEDLLWWGAMDTDILNRAGLSGLEMEWVSERTAMLHQWHPRKEGILTDDLEVRQARHFWERNHRIMKERAGIRLRNPRGWGGVVD